MFFGIAPIPPDIVTLIGIFDKSVCEKNAPLFSQAYARGFRNCTAYFSLPTTFSSPDTHCAVCLRQIYRL